MLHLPFQAFSYEIEYPKPFFISTIKLLIGVEGLFFTEFNTIEPIWLESRLTWSAGCMVDKHVWTANLPYFPLEILFAIGKNIRILTRGINHYVQNLTKGVVSPIFTMQNYYGWKSVVHERRAFLTQVGNLKWMCMQ